MGKPHRFMIGGAVRLWTRIHVSEIERFIASPTQSREISWVQREKRALVYRLIEQTVAGDAFQLQGRDKRGARNFFRLLGKILHHITVGSLTRNTRLGLQKADAWRIFQLRFKPFHVSCADFRLRGKPVELRAEDGGLKFSHAVIKSDNSVVIFVREARAASVDVALHAFHVFQVVGYDRAPFSRGDELARLEAEGS